MVSRPSVPAPMTTTTSPGRSTPARAAWTAQAVARPSPRPRRSGRRARVQLAAVGHHRRRPAAAGVAAEPGLQAGLEVAEGDALARLTGRPGAGRARRVDAPGGAAEHGLDHHPACRRRGRPRPRGRARTGTTRWARSSGTTCRRWWPGRCRRCRPGGAAARTQSAPGQRGRVDVDAARSGPTRRPGAGRSAPATMAAAKRAGLRANTSAFIAAPVLGSASRWRRSERAAAERQGRADGQQRAGGAPGGLGAKCSTSQPRLRARAARRVSGLTATGKPTASSMGRSEVESA